tara:strand:- start:1065 stop:1355 length:291 start_codon:yes stop_codon:yes gene_type:complete
MQKYLNIQGTAAAGFQGNQLVSINGIKTVRAATATNVATLIQYEDGTTTTVTTAAQVGFNVQIKIQDSILLALSTSWTNPVYDITLPKAITSIVNA